MTPLEYSLWRREVDFYPRSEFSLGFYGLGLTGESGEVAEKIKKWYRDGASLTTDDLLNELGDVLWYLTAIADSFGFGLQQVIDANVKKLEDRRARGVERGSGDRR